MRWWRLVGVFCSFLVIAAVVLLIVQAWREVLHPSSDSDDVQSVLTEATLQPDGVVALRTTYRFRDAPEQFRVSAWSGVDNVRVNGEPVSGPGVSTVDDPGATVVVEAELFEATERYSDGAVVTVPLVESLISVTDDLRGWFDVQAVLYAGPAAQPLEVTTSLADERQEVSGGTARLSGRLSGWDNGQAVLLVPVAAVPDAEVLEGGLARSTYGSESTSLRLTRPNTTVRDQERTVQLVATIVLTVVGGLGLAVWLLGILRTLAQRARVKVAGLGERDTPPDLPPALVGVATGSAGRGERSLVAATILDLVSHDLVEIDGITSEHFVLRVPEGAVGVTGSERAVLDALRQRAGAQRAGAAVELTGPPLWADERRPAWLRGYRRALVGEASKAGLVAPVFRGAVFFVLSIACGILGSIALLGSPLGIILATVGPWVALVAGFLTGKVLTRKGLDVRAHGEAYGRYLRENTELTEVGAPGVVLWERTLAYAAALGAAPKAAEALSPRLSKGA
jgi:Predicted membrane protein (DUF2207) C-terminal domain